MHGFVDIESLVPLGFSEVDQISPDSGQLLLTGSGNASITVTALSSENVRLDLDLDGDKGPPTPFAAYLGTSLNTRQMEFQPRLSNP